MLTQLLTDTTALTTNLPTLQTTANQMQVDLAASPPVTMDTLLADAQALTVAVAPVIANIGALQTDLSALRQAIAPSDHAELGVQMASIDWTAIIADIKKLIANGVTNLPAILAALQAMGIVIPPQVTAIIQVLILLLGGTVPPATAA